MAVTAISKEESAMKRLKKTGLFLLGAAAAAGVLLGSRVLPVTRSSADVKTSSRTQAEAVSKKKVKSKAGNRKNAVVLYFTGTGNTGKIAGKIHKAAGGKLIRIKASDPYTDADLDYSKDSSRVVKEHESNGGDGKTPLDSSVRPGIKNLSAIRKAVKKADTVYIGYPIWWQQAPHIMYTLVENVSLNGKKVVPFNSSMSSGSGRSSDNLLKDARVNGKTVWLSGKGFTDAGPSQRSVNGWVKKINRTNKGKKISAKASDRSGSTSSGKANASGSSDNIKAGSSNNNGAAEAAASPAPSKAPKAGSGKSLVVYFSATGNTERVAKAVADETGSDIFVITPSQPYTRDDLNFNDRNSRVVREYEDQSLRNTELSSTDVPGWSNYDRVFIGYPIWWGNAAWPVNSFVKANDFTGKTVIPFCTSLSSGIGNSGANLKAIAGEKGNWQTGQRFSENAGDSEVKIWVNSL